MITARALRDACQLRYTIVAKSIQFTLLMALVSLVLSSCAQSLPETTERAPVTVQLEADGQNHRLASDKTTVRELLEEAGISLGETDEVTPPLFTPLESDLEITVVRVKENTDTILHSIPFERKIVRNESMDADAEPVILQAGTAGLQEETIRTVFRDGEESERWVTQVTLIEPAQDEIIMIGIGVARGNVAIPGILAYDSDGAALILRGLTGFPEQLNSGGGLDGRVFSLSPTGSHLLYTRTTSNSVGFSNSLWMIGTERNAEPQPLGVEDVLWADWNPDRISPMQIGFSTADGTNLPPGWEANNDFWIADIPSNGEQSLQSEQLVEAYPATYGWWGGNYAWSPTGRYVAYGYANEVGLIDTEGNGETGRHIQLQRFTEYNTLLDWVWVPTLSWSPDGRYLAFTNHGGEEPEAMSFDSWVVDVESAVGGRFVEQAGMWGHLRWAPVSDGKSANGQRDSQIAFLKSRDPVNSLRSSYSLWLMDRDGSNSRQIYPPPGENSHFPREQQFMAWAPEADYIAFIFNNALHMLNLESGESWRITQDDAINSHPTWAPYGRGLGIETTIPRRDEPITPDLDDLEQRFEEFQSR